MKIELLKFHTQGLTWAFDLKPLCKKNDVYVNLKKILLQNRK